MNHPARLLVVGLVLTTLVSTGCSSFRRDARQARQRPPASGSVEGLWEGRWHRSDKPDHGGTMQVVLTRTGDQTYRAATRSKWWGVFRSAYDSTWVFTPVAPGQHQFQASQDLWGFGGYAVTGRVDQAQLQAVFHAGGHSGVMELRRPASP